MSNTKPDVKNIKKENIKSMFVDAAKSIIIHDGISNVTARKIAEITGYSYASIYHYFSDLNELLLETKLLMIRDMIAYNKEKQEGMQVSNPLQLIKEQTRFPVDYFMDNPNIFGFFYSYKMDARNEEAMRSLEIEKEYWDVFLPFAEKGTIKRRDISIIARTILYAVYGMITLCLSNNGLSKEDIYHDMDDMIDLLLKEGKNNEDPW